MLPDMSLLEHFHFLRPAWGLLLIPWLAIAWVRRRKRAREDRFRGIIAPHLLEHLRLTRFESRWFNPQRVSAVLILLLLLLLMGPSWRQQPSPLSVDESRLVILLDVSESMQQTDIQPSRLQRAKQKIVDLLELRQDKKAALVVFAGSAHLVLSPTSDRDILRQYLSAIDPKIMPRRGKFPEYALPLADTLLRAAETPATVVLFTDAPGADSGGAFKQWFEQRPHQLLVVGVGTESDNAMPLEQASLKRLARDSGGRYISLSVDNSDMRRVNRRINSHYVVAEDSALPWLDSGYWLVFPALALFLMWFRRGWTLTWGWMLVPLLITVQAPETRAQEPTDTGSAAARWFADLWLTADQQGRLLMQAGRYARAAQRFENPLWKGTAYYYNEEFMLAAEYYSRSDTEDALFNEANARAHARDYLRAVSRYDQLLALNPQYPGAHENRARVQELIDEINRLSESQQQEAGVSSEEKSLSGDDALPAMGADELVWKESELRQLSAEEILQDPATQEMWLRSVQQDPGNFLAIKFGMQLQRAAAAVEPRR